MLWDGDDLRVALVHNLTFKINRRKKSLVVPLGILSTSHGTSTTELGNLPTFILAEAGGGVSVSMHQSSTRFHLEGQGFFMGLDKSSLGKETQLEGEARQAEHKSPTFFFLPEFQCAKI